MVRISVLPFMMDPIYGVPFVILGRSRPVESWKEGSFLWSDFGGLVHEKDKNIETTAAREIVEELLGLLVTKEDMYVFIKALQDQIYIMKVSNEFHTVYVVRFAWKPSLPFEFSKLHLHLKALSHICRNIPLNAAERIALCRYKWLQSDTNLKQLIKHPAIQIRKQILPTSVVENASNQLSECLGSKKRNFTVKETTLSCYVIDHVKSSYLEKDKIELFSIQQLQCAIRPEGLVCGQGQCIQICPTYAPLLKGIIRALLTGQLTCTLSTNR